MSPITYHTLRLSGDPDALGRSQADLLQLAAPPLRRPPWERDQRFLAGCANVVADVAPRLWAELRAFAAAAGLSPEQAVFARAGLGPQGCSAFAWRLPDGQVIAGRNYDFYAGLATRSLLITRPSHGYAHLGMNGGLVGGRYDGMNERGLFVALHKVMASRPEPTPPGLPFHLLIRAALEGCADAREAASFISGVPHIASFNYTLADAQGNLIALECHPGLPVRARHCARSLAVANHYTHPALAPLQGRRPLEGSRARVERMKQLPPPHVDPVRAAKAVLADHEAPVCAHREFGATLWSGVFDLGARRAAYAFGPPCRTPFSEEHTL